MTIIPLDTTQNTPVFQSPTNLASYFELSYPGIRLSHLVLVGGKVTRHAVGINYGATGAILDHMRASDFTLQGINSGASMVTIGPGVVVAHGGVGGLQVYGGSLTVLGGQGAEHTSITGNSFGGLWLHGSVEVRVAATDIDPNRPDVSDIDTDDNGAAGVVFDAAGDGYTGTETVTIRGLHSTGSPVGIRADGPSTQILIVRGSYLADNTQSAVRLSSSPLAAPSTFDFGAPGGTDPGRNVFESPKQPATVNTQGAICLATAGQVLAAGNVFGATDCAVGGTLSHSATCASQVDIGGLVPGSSSIDVSHCR